MGWDVITFVAQEHMFDAGMCFREKFLQEVTFLNVPTGSRFQQHGIRATGMCASARKVNIPARNAVVALHQTCVHVQGT